MKEIFFIKDRCVECRSCESACIIEHSKDTNVHFILEDEIPLPPKRINEEITNSIIEWYPYPARCKHCEEPQCVEACIGAALYKDEVTGRIALKEDRCVGCWMCAMACPYSAIIPIKKKSKIIKCDHCLLSTVPRCVWACPKQALVYREIEDYKREKRIGIKWWDQREELEKLIE